MAPDFSGYATKTGLKCSDGRTIMPDAFKDCEGMTVPLVWQHGHSESINILGHAVLENRSDGVYTYGYFNDTSQGKNAKALVQHKDISALSIYATQLVERSKNVLHGLIREVSLVLSGANPGALIDNISISHSNGDTEVLDDEAVIYTGLPIENEDKLVKHSAEDPTVQEVYDSFSDIQKDVVNYMIGAALEASTESVQHSEDTDSNSNIEEDSNENDENDEDENDEDENNENVDENDAEGDNAEGETNEGDLNHKEGNQDMSRNVFEQNGGATVTRPTLTHAQLQTIVEDAQKIGSFKESFLAHAVEYGIENIDFLFPDAKTIADSPEFVSRRMEWVSQVIDGTKHSPFSRIKSMSADITLDTARAKGYVKGNLKKEEFFALAKRVTTPTTIYKKQKLDRDDIIDITDLEVVAWLKAEMRVMLDEELARVVLIGDGREVDDEDKINETHIRPIAHDDNFYAHHVVVPANTSPDGLVEAILRSRVNYRGAGNPTMFCTEEFLTDLILSKDKMNRRQYATQTELEAALRVSKIVVVPVMDAATTSDGDLLAILANLSDYTLGADKGGNVSMFDDFDIDYNQYKYLIETRCSGALTKFKTALVYSRVSGTSVTPGVPTFNNVTGVLTVPATTGVVYTNGDSGAVLSAGAQSAIAAGATVEVEAAPADGYNFPHNIDTDWEFTRDA